MYQDVVFMYGDEADEVFTMLYDINGVVWSGPYAETITATVNHLKQWDNGEGEIYAESKAGAEDRKVEEDGYLLTWNSGFGYIGLERIVTGHLVPIGTEPCLMCGDPSVPEGSGPLCPRCEADQINEADGMLP